MNFTITGENCEERVFSCETIEDLMTFAREAGIELTDEDIDNIAAGNCDLGAPCGSAQVAGCDLVHLAF